MFKKIVSWIVGRKFIPATGQMSAASKAKLTAVIGVIVAAIGPISQAWGHPITIPQWVFEVLGGMGLWTLRDAMPAKQPNP